jgi:Kef-type K+ transport system membrane component KefB
MSGDTSIRRPRRALGAYSILLAAAVIAFLLIRARGVTLTAPTSESATVSAVGTSTGTGHALFHVLLALAAVIALGRVLGKAFSYVGQPPVIGEVVAGIVLGPSLLGRISPQAMAFLLPKEAAAHLGIIAQIGAVLYMFIVGLELNTGHLRTFARSVVAVSLTGLVVPFVAGAGLALWLYPQFSNRAVPFTSFALFVGTAVAITAFPILARILKDRGLDRTAVGITALGAAAIADVIAWCLLAVVVGVARDDVGAAMYVLFWTAIFIGAMLLIVRPLVFVFVRRHGDATAMPGAIALTLVGVLLASLATESIGIHAVFGAFLLGALIPHDSVLARDVSRKFTDVVTVLLLPAFFAFTGLRTEIGLLDSPAAWATCGLVIVVAYVAKFGSALLAARLTGSDWRSAAAIGTLMTTHGLMELIVLNIGLDLGVISPTLFAMMVIMALVTTLMAAPCLRFILRPSSMVASAA